MSDDPWGDTGNSGWGPSETDGTDINANKNGSGCRNCGEEGHFARECPTKKKGCFNCGEEGHNRADCPKGGSGPKRGCFNCGEEGHNKADCPSGPMTRVIEREDGTKSEIYVPPEIKDDDLFNQGYEAGINFDKYDKIPVNCSGENAPAPMMTFGEMGLRSLIQDNINKCGYSKPTPIQRMAVPCILQGRDVMGCAQTGSGKTAAFVLPILHKIMEEDYSVEPGDCPQKPYAVVVAPTRELAIQIKDEARKFAAGSMVRPVVVYGGTSTGFQLSQVFRGTSILIATPGRLMDFVDKGKVSFENVKLLVLDEADRMLDMGFLPEIQRIVNSAGMPKSGDRQTLMFSATFPQLVQELANEFLHNYLFVAIGIVGGACSDVKQEFLEVQKFDKRERLKEMLDDVGTDRTLVFVETRKSADFLATYLSSTGLPTTSIHGDRLQRERETALADFKSGKMPVLVATAVAARGLDIKGVRHVINYDLPKTIDEYVHRIGRTGRVGHTGKATSFFDPTVDESIAGDLKKILADSMQDMPDCLENCMGAGMGGQGAFGGVDIRGGGGSNGNGAANEQW